MAVDRTQRVDHSMRAMDAMMAFGDHQQVIGGIFENVHSMEVRDTALRSCYTSWCLGCSLIRPSESWPSKHIGMT